MTRKYLTPNELRDMLERQHGVCAARDCMSEGPFHADHSTPHIWDDKKPDQLLCIPCHKRKTRRDVASIAKAKRISNARTQYDKRKQNGSRLRSAGFRGWRTLSGEVKWVKQSP